MKHEKRKPPKIYWIRVAVDAEISYPSAYVGALVDEIREGIHTQHAAHMSESSLLALIEGAIHAEISEDTDTGAQAAQAAGLALHTRSSADVPSAKRGADAKREAAR